MSMKCLRMLAKVSILFVLKKLFFTFASLFDEKNVCYDEKNQKTH